MALKQFLELYGQASEVAQRALAAYEQAKDVDSSRPGGAQFGLAAVERAAEEFKPVVNEVVRGRKTERLVDGKVVESRTQSYARSYRISEGPAAALSSANVSVGGALLANGGSMVHVGPGSAIAAGPGGVPQASRVATEKRSASGIRG